MSPKKPPPAANETDQAYYLAKPKSETKQGVLVLHAWWGLNRFFKEFCDRLAQAGFTVLAPDLYHGLTASTIDEAKKLRSKLKQATVTKDIISAANQLRSLCGAKRIGVIGFSLGGYWALWLAEQKPSAIAATVVFYGSRNGNYAKCRSAFQFHLAEIDDYVASSGIKKLQKNLEAHGKSAMFYTYVHASHWFFETDRGNAYKPDAAWLAWSRTIEFLKKHISET